MSFSSDVKKELCRTVPEGKCCARAELAGIISFCGFTRPAKDGDIFTVKTENAAVARRVYTLIKRLLGVSIAITPVRRGKKSNSYIIELNDRTLFKKILTETGLLENNSVRFAINSFIVQEVCCQRAYIRGAFLGGGSVNSPEKSYHFEIETHYFRLSRDLTALFAELELGARCIVRKSNYVIYLKDSEKIGEALASMGAADSMMELCNIKILKDMKNTINRQVNCETANVGKTASAAAQQIRSIKKIIERRGLASLPEELAELAVLRMENPEVSLAELCGMLKAPISRSGVNHRLKKLIEIAESIT